MENGDVCERERKRIIDFSVNLNRLARIHGTRRTLLQKRSMIIVDDAVRHLRHKHIIFASNNFLGVQIFFDFNQPMVNWFGIFVEIVELRIWRTD